MHHNLSHILSKNILDSHNQPYVRKLGETKDRTAKWSCSEMLILRPSF